MQNFTSNTKVMTDPRQLEFVQPSQEEKSAMSKRGVYRGTVFLILRAISLVHTATEMTMAFLLDNVIYCARLLLPTTHK